MIEVNIQDISREALNTITSKFKELYSKVYRSLDTDSDIDSSIDQGGNLSIDEKKKYICANVDKLDVPDRTALAHIIIDRDGIDLLKGTNEGCVVNLDPVNPVAINQMYALMQYKISSNNSSINE